MDIWPSIYATLKSDDFFMVTLDGFEDSSGHFKVFLDGEAPTNETPFLSVLINPGEQGRNNDWTRPFVTFTAYGKVTDRRKLKSITRAIRSIFKQLSEFEEVRSTFTAAVSDVCTCKDHQLENGDTVTLTTTDTLPAGLATATTYYVIDRTLDTFKLSASEGGSAVNITDTGTGKHTIVRSPVQYELIGEAIYDEGRNPVTEHIAASVALRFGIQQ